MTCMRCIVLLLLLLLFLLVVVVAMVVVLWCCGVLQLVWLWFVHKAHQNWRWRSSPSSPSSPPLSSPWMVKCLWTVSKKQEVASNKSNNRNSNNNNDGGDDDDDDNNNNNNNTNNTTNNSNRSTHMQVTCRRLDSQWQAFENSQRSDVWHAALGTALPQSIWISSVMWQLLYGSWPLEVAAKKTKNKNIQTDCMSCCCCCCCCCMADLKTQLLSVYFVFNVACWCCCW